MEQRWEGEPEEGGLEMEWLKGQRGTTCRGQCRGEPCLLSLFPSLQRVRVFSCVALTHLPPSSPLTLWSPSGTLPFFHFFVLSLSLCLSLYLSQLSIYLSLYLLSQNVYSCVYRAEHLIGRASLSFKMSRSRAREDTLRQKQSKDKS